MSEQGETGRVLLLVQWLFRSTCCTTVAPPSKKRWCFGVLSEKGAVVYVGGGWVEEGGM